MVVTHSSQWKHTAPVMSTSSQVHNHNGYKYQRETQRELRERETERETLRQTHRQTVRDTERELETLLCNLQGL